jgi:serine/threonine-protein kinase
MTYHPQVLTVLSVPDWSHFNLFQRISTDCTFIARLRTAIVSNQLGPELKRSKYRLLGLVGQGQFGQVFCAAHRQTGRLVALKNLDRHRFPTHKFLRELRFLLSLQHPNIVTCMALEHTHTGRYLVMDYCEGGTLRSLMAEDNRLSLPQSLKLIADILAGLEHAHNREIVHCDIKPENILLSVQPTGWTARISDFGIARLKQEMAGQESSNTGSPAYMAPERFYGQYSQTSDLYSVGILLFELITGYRPFSGTPAELMSAHLNRPVKLPDTVPDLWKPIIITALQKLSARRFRSAGEMLSALRSIAASDGSGSWLDPEAIHLPLLTSTVASSHCPFQVQWQEPVQQPITALAIAAQVTAPIPAPIPNPNVNPNANHDSLRSPVPSSQPEKSATRLYWTGENRIVVGHDEVSLAEPAFQPSSQAISLGRGYAVSFKDTVRDLLLRPQGCFVVTARSIYLLPSRRGMELQRSPQRVFNTDQIFVAAIESQGRWLASLMIHSDTDASSASSLVFQYLPDTHPAMALAQQPVRLSSKWLSIQLPQLLPLDQRHVAIVVDLPHRQLVHAPDSVSSPGTLVKVMTRRGSRVGSLILPLQIGGAILTPTPYRLLAIDRHHATSIVLIDLKPYRMVRLATEIQPEFLAATAWGYILANRQGQIGFIDQEGRAIGQVDAPAPITAIAPYNHNLLVATWDGQQGALRALDMRELGLDLLF